MTTDQTPDSTPRPTSAEREGDSDLDALSDFANQMGGSFVGEQLHAVIRLCRAARATIRRLEAEGAGLREDRDAFEQAGYAYSRQIHELIELQKRTAESLSSALAREAALRGALAALTAKAPIHSDEFKTSCACCDGNAGTMDYYQPDNFPHEADCPWVKARAVLATPAPAGGVTLSVEEARALSIAVIDGTDWPITWTAVDYARELESAKAKLRQGAGPEEK